MACTYGEQLSVERNFSKGDMRRLCKQRDIFFTESDTKEQLAAKLLVFAEAKDSLPPRSVPRFLPAVPEEQMWKVWWLVDNFSHSDLTDVCAQRGIVFRTGDTQQDLALRIVHDAESRRAAKREDERRETDQQLIERVRAIGRERPKAWEVAPEPFHHRHWPEPAAHPSTVAPDHAADVAQQRAHAQAEAIKLPSTHPEQYTAPTFFTGEEWKREWLMANFSRKELRQLCEERGVVIGTRDSHRELATKLILSRSTIQHKLPGSSPQKIPYDFGPGVSRFDASEFPRDVESRRNRQQAREAGAALRGDDVSHPELRAAEAVHVPTGAGRETAPGRCEACDRRRAEETDESFSRPQETDADTAAQRVDPFTTEASGEIRTVGGRVVYPAYLRDPRKTAGTIMRLAEEKIAEVSRHGSFKIGLTRDPERRFRQPDYKTSFRQMHTLACFDTFQGAAVLESHLIEKFGAHPNCLNRLAGGDGREGLRGPYFVYVVHGGASLVGKALRDNAHR